MKEWISVEDRLPNDDSCLVFFKDINTGHGWIEIDHLSEFSPKSMFEGFQRIGSDRWIKATHWMPLPKPPEED